MPPGRPKKPEVTEQVKPVILPVRVENTPSSPPSRVTNYIPKAVTGNSVRIYSKKTGKITNMDRKMAEMMQKKYPNEFQIM